MRKTSLALKVDRRPLAWLCAGLVVAAVVALAGCSTPGTAPNAKRERGFDPRQLIKTDINRVAETHQQHIFASLRRLADKLYKRNPREWRKTGAPSAEAAISRIFDEQHRWRFESLGNRRDLDALHVALHPEFRGDRVQALIVGLGSMVQSAFGDREVFYLLDDLEPQHLYNAARNVEIAAWKLATARDGQGQLLLLSNELGESSNLSFEREFGRIVGLLDVLSDVVEEETERTVTRVVQNLTTAVFLPVY
ncbi:MAG: hypothetical protein RBS10_13435 [Thauera propionica]|nr:MULTISPECIES: hypothetical protein [Thauera]MDD3676093.1 hypothetical protein [Thauera propionica]MDI3489510.1 hypothetical protein [Thauera sp.]MDY0048414.1 hypothetical protein [Thauera propionica]